mmetsp:Transcript_33825/g.34453  ORF Transcript_33825/g.34453 Transcript_33825/m.34453 type:complete len:614 (+) Transcript_33825:49-1890(+)|eukprot:CAMPEP_0182419622 /NCGR_PEP_ID=MMETSP1167-20130531/4031_1 /TAXON_ID=2988 /ORGANISM="Mallomonas Sp, Strain CCMP3275" /LENGTH=613 /DNA_ID=CAMNT_0024594633 /DNA_START=33 /DNA_END=1874 /DNA_ORIENTATION=-
MDRGRVGVDLLANKIVRDKQISVNFEIHDKKLQEIKARKPGTSLITIDNLPPSCAEIVKSNVKKKKIEADTNVIVGRQNKILLQRIGNILTAPPKVTDTDYVKTKNVIPTLKLKGQWLYEANLRDKNFKKMKERIRNMPSMYSTKQWETEYQSQLHSQEKFMRQVKYKRPKGFIEPWKSVSAENETEEINEYGIRVIRSKVSASTSTLRTSTPTKSVVRSHTMPSSSHVNRIRHMKGNNKEGTPGGKSKRSQSESDAEGGEESIDGIEQEGEEEKETSYGEEEYETYEKEEEGVSLKGTVEEPTSNRKLLSQNTRILQVKCYQDACIADDNSVYDNDSIGSSISSEYTKTNQRHPHAVLEMITDLSVWLEGKSTLLITADHRKDNNTCIEALHIVELSTLSSINQHAVTEMLRKDSDWELITLANEMIEMVEMRMDNGLARLVLSMASEFITDKELEEIAVKQFDFTQASASEIEQMLRDAEPLVLSFGRCLPLFVVKPVTDSMHAHGSILRPVGTQAAEKIYALLKIKRLGDEKIHITATFCASSTTCGGKGSKAYTPVVMANSILTLVVGLPSVMLADDELITEYFHNVSSNIVIDYLPTENKCALSLRLM